MPSKVVHPESIERVRRTDHSSPAWTAAAASGFDMCLVELSLEKAPWARLLEHDEAQAFAARLRAAGAQAHAKP